MVKATHIETFRTVLKILSYYLAGIYIQVSFLKRYMEVIGLPKAVLHLLLNGGCASPKIWCVSCCNLLYICQIVSHVIWSGNG